MEDGSSFGVEFWIDKGSQDGLKEIAADTASKTTGCLVWINAGSEDSFGDGKEDVSLLGVKLCINKGSKDGFEDGCSDGNEDGSLLGVKLSLDEESEDGFKDGSRKCKWKSSSVSLHIISLSSKFLDWPISITSSESSSSE
jgi:hypothetical protein